MSSHILSYLKKIWHTQFPLIKIEFFYWLINFVSHSLYIYVNYLPTPVFNMSVHVITGTQVGSVVVIRIHEDVEKLLMASHEKELGMLEKEYSINLLYYSSMCVQS